MDLKKYPFKDDINLWLSYKNNPKDEKRNKLIEMYFPLVEINAKKIISRRPNKMEISDLISAGTFGLIDSIKTYDPLRKVKFATYASHRIRGAIIDELRMLDWVPRLVRIRNKSLENLLSKLENFLMRKPYQNEIEREVVKVYNEKSELMIKNLNPKSQKKISEMYNETKQDKNKNIIDLFEDKKIRQPHEDMLRKDLREKLMRGFSRTEKLILTLIYYENMGLHETGKIVGISESRTSQIHEEILQKFKERYSREEFI